MPSSLGCKGLPSTRPYPVGRTRRFRPNSSTSPGITGRTLLLFPWPPRCRRSALATNSVPGRETSLYCQCRTYTASIEICFRLLSTGRDLDTRLCRCRGCCDRLFPRRLFCLALRQAILCYKQCFGRHIAHTFATNNERHHRAVYSRYNHI